MVTVSTSSSSTTTTDPPMVIDEVRSYPPRCVDGDNIISGVAIEIRRSGDTYNISVNSPEILQSCPIQFFDGTRIYNGLSVEVVLSGD